MKKKELKKRLRNYEEYVGLNESRITELEIAENR